LGITENQKVKIKSAKLGGEDDFKEIRLFKKYSFVLLKNDKNIYNIEMYEESTKKLDEKILQTDMILIIDLGESTYIWIGDRVVLSESERVLLFLYAKKVLEIFEKQNIIKIINQGNEPIEFLKNFNEEKISENKNKFQLKKKMSIKINEDEMNENIKVFLEKIEKITKMLKNITLEDITKQYNFEGREEKSKKKKRRSILSILPMFSSEKEEPQNENISKEFFIEEKPIIKSEFILNSPRKRSNTGTMLSPTQKNSLARVDELIKKNSEFKLLRESRIKNIVKNIKDINMNQLFNIEEYDKYEMQEKEIFQIEKLYFEKESNLISKEEFLEKKNEILLNVQKNLFINDINQNNKFKETHKSNENKYNGHININELMIKNSELKEIRDLRIKNIVSNIKKNGKILL
jgi:hypothetical protein